MKSTGIVRRMDDLRRVVIPKEVTRAMQWQEGDPLEIYTMPDAVILKKYRPEEELIETSTHAEETQSVIYKLVTYVWNEINEKRESEQTWYFANETRMNEFLAEYSRLQNNNTLPAGLARYHDIPEIIMLIK